MKINTKDFKLVVTKAVAATMTLVCMITAGCGKKKNEISSETSSYETTIETTIQTTAEPTQTTVVENSILKYEEEANNFYEANKDFFIKEYGTDKELAIRDINNTILVLTNDSETITNEDLGKTFNAMDRMFMPTDVRQNAGNYMTEDPIEQSDRLPDLSRYVQNEAARKIINANTVVINNFVDALNSGDSEKIAEARKNLLARVAYIEDEHDDILQELGETSMGDELALNMSFKGIVDLAGVLVVNGRLTYIDKNGVEQTRALIPNAYESAVLEAYRNGTENNIPFDTKVIDDTTVNGRYVKYLGADGFEDIFVTESEKEKIEDDLVITKYQEAINMLESKYSNISAEYYSLNSDCYKKTL